MDNNKCCRKRTIRNEEEKKLLNNRLNRIEGQIRGVRKMISDDAYCNDILIQLSAIENSVKSLSNQMLENHLYTCIARDMENGKFDTIDEIISLFKRFNKLNYRKELMIYERINFTSKWYDVYRM